MGLAYQSRYQEDEIQVDLGERLVLTGGRAARRRREAKKRKKFRRLLALAVLGFVALWLLGGYVSGLFKIVQLKADIAQVEREIDLVNGEITQLEAEKILVESPEFVEQVAREKLGLVMPGEVKYVITRPVAGQTGEKDVEIRQESYQEPLY